MPTILESNIINIIRKKLQYRAIEQGCGLYKQFSLNFVTMVGLLSRRSKLGISILHKENRYTKHRNRLQVGLIVATIVRQLERREEGIYQPEIYI